LKENDFLFPRFPDFLKNVKVTKRIVSKSVVQIKSGKRGNRNSFSFNLYRKRSKTNELMTRLFCACSKTFENGLEWTALVSLRQYSA
jgi:hypothetical protein